jgi:hypothetical protein
MLSRALSITLKASFDSESVLVLVRKVLRPLVNIMYAKKGNWMTRLHGVVALETIAYVLVGLSFIPRRYRAPTESIFCLTLFRRWIRHVKLLCTMRSLDCTAGKGDDCEMLVEVLVPVDLRTACPLMVGRGLDLGFFLGAWYTIWWYFIHAPSLS